MEHIEHGQAPDYYRGLTMAESVQLSMDYQTSSETFEAVRLFCGKYVDERTAVAEELSKHLEVVDHFNRNQLAYLEVFDEVGLRRHHNMFRDPDLKAEPETVIRTAHSAAGAHMLDLRIAVRESRIEFLSKADGLSVLLAEFCQKRLEGAPLLIMGKQFDYGLGVLTCREQEYPASPRLQHVLYGSQARFIDLRQKLVKDLHLTTKDANDLRYGQGTADDWNRLLNNLNCLTQF